MKTKVAPFRRVSTLSGLNPVLIAVVSSAFTSTSFAQQNLCDLDPNWPIISQSSNQYVFHLSAGQCVAFYVVDSCWCPSTPPNVCFCGISIEWGGGLEDWNWSCHEVPPGYYAMQCYWDNGKLVPYSGPLYCFTAPEDDTYTFTADFCGSEAVRIECVDCSGSPCQ